MHKCQNPKCDAQIPNNLNYCSQECGVKARELREQNRTQGKEEQQNNPTNIFWSKGEGMMRRDHNIETIIELMLQGLSYQEIWKKSRRFFTSRKFDEYYEIASDEINLQSSSESKKENTQNAN